MKVAHATEFGGDKVTVGLRRVQRVLWFEVVTHGGAGNRRPRDRQGAGARRESDAHAAGVSTEVAKPAWFHAD